MAKRLTNTEKWKQSLLKGLPPEYKLLWLYIEDNCDHSGIWEVEIEIAESRLGINLSKERALGHFSENVVVFDSGNKWFLPGFVEFQYGTLDPNNRVHRSVINTLMKYKLLKENKGHASPLIGAKDKDKDKDFIDNTSIDNTVLISGESFFLADGRPDYAPQPISVAECFCRLGKSTTDAREFFNYYEGLNWKKGITPIQNWQAFANRWDSKPQKNTAITSTPYVPKPKDLD